MLTVEKDKVCGHNLSCPNFHYIPDSQEPGLNQLPALLAQNAILSGVSLRDFFEYLAISIVPLQIFKSLLGHCNE